MVTNKYFLCASCVAYYWLTFDTCRLWQSSFSSSLKFNYIEIKRVSPQMSPINYRSENNPEIILVWQGGSSIPQWQRSKVYESSSHDNPVGRNIAVCRGFLVVFCSLARYRAVSGWHLGACPGCDILISCAIMPISHVINTLPKDTLALDLPLRITHISQKQQNAGHKTCFWTYISQKSVRAVHVQICKQLEEGKESCRGVGKGRKKYVRFLHSNPLAAAVLTCCKYKL